MKKTKIKLITGVEVEHTTKNKVTTIKVPGETPEPFRWNIEEYEERQLKRKLEKTKAERQKELYTSDRIKELAYQENWRIANCLN